jgi:hypothetical protein
MTNHALFNNTQVTVGTNLRRGARVTCGYCDKSHSIAVNQMQGIGDDEEIVEGYIAKKFENLGWLIGRRAIDHRCPECFAAIKASNARKRREKEMANNKVVPMNSPAEVLNPISRDDRRLIFEKLRDVYANETTGYKDDWTDEKVATDLGASRAWISKIREENFGPDINENSVKLFDEARQWLEDIAKLRDIIEGLFPQWHKMLAKGAPLEQSLRKFCENK